MEQVKKLKKMIFQNEKTKSFNLKLTDFKMIFKELALYLRNCRPDY